MKRLLVLVILLGMVKSQVFATHVRAGEFSYSYVGGNTFKVQIRTYTEISAGSIAADQNSLPMDWGDGTTDTILRLPGSAGRKTIATGSYPALLGYVIQENIYEGSHTYPGFGIYCLRMQDVNRVASIANINGGVNSDQIPMEVEDSLYFLDPAIFGPVNNSPILSTHAVDFGQVFKIFHHIPAAYDPDGDSLSYEIYDPFQSQGIPVPNWILPNAVTGSTVGTFTIDPLTGIITWDYPTYQGIVNVGIKIKEYRRRIENGATKYFVMGTMMRDLQIIIGPGSNHPPIFTLRDTCIMAGAHLVMNIGAKDIDAGQHIGVTATGGPFYFIKNPATLDTTFVGVDTTHLFFNWQTICDHIDARPYTVLVTATDNGSPAATTIGSFTIKVLGPPPQNLTAKEQGGAIVLKWDSPYACDGTQTTRFLGFSIWRKEGCDLSAVDSCNEGVDGLGYIEIASRLQTYGYTDKSVQIGNEYTYRVVAEFADTTSLGYIVQFSRSVASNGACSQLKKDLPVITKASVNTTSITNGSVRVEWSNPNPILLDTIQNKSPYRYEVYHSPDFNFNNQSGPIKVYSSPTFKGIIPDTTYTDTLIIDTKDSVHSYIIKFYSNDSLLGQTRNASTIFLTLAAASRQLTLNWSENVPWTNDKYVVYRRDNHTSGNFDSIATTSTQTYIDKGLKNDSTYCYRIKSIGHYSAPGLPDTIINFSQENCSVPIDTIGPCAPVLTVQNQCTGSSSLEAFTNYLSWSKPDISCGGDALKYYVYYAPDANSALALLDSNHLVNQDTLAHHLDNTVAGCYAVAAVDSYYNKGPLSAIVCVDNCPEYNLPNTFTPNNDASNSLFVPRNPYRFIAKVDMKIYTSWGSLVFETSDPAIKWDGKIESSGKEAPDGTYYYVCEVFEERLIASNTPSKILSGFIHLYR